MSIQKPKMVFISNCAGIPVEPANYVRYASIMANGQTSFIGGANLRRSGLRVLSAGCQGFRRHDGNRRHELRSLAVNSSPSIGGNNLDLWFLDGTQLRSLSERTKIDESLHDCDSGHSNVHIRTATTEG